MRGKLVGLFAVVLLALVGLLGRITYINATSGKKYKKQVLTQAQQKYQNSILPAKRGDIYDRNGNILATSQKVYSVILDCKTVNSDEKYVEPTVRALTDVWIPYSCDSGLQHHLHLNTQPFRKTIVRIPGPSWIEYRWTSKMRPFVCK